MGRNPRAVDLKGPNVFQCLERIKSHKRSNLSKCDFGEVNSESNMFYINSLAHPTIRQIATDGHRPESSSSNVTVSRLNCLMMSRIVAIAASGVLGVFLPVDISPSLVPRHGLLKVFLDISPFRGLLKVMVVDV